MKSILTLTLVTLTALITVCSAQAKSGDECRINVFTPTRESDIAAANIINHILIEKGYTPVSDDSAALTHNATSAGFGETNCSLSKYGMKKINAMAEIIENSKTVDVQYADDAETSDSCANLNKARINATLKLKSCSEL